MGATFFISTIFLIILPTCTESFELVRTNSYLPHLSSEHALVYDGEDSIFTIGGSSGCVVKYSIASGVVETVGLFLEIGYGAAVMNGDEIVYIGGRILDSRSEVSSDVHSYSTLSNNYTRIGQLPVPMRNMALAWDPVAQIAYLLGGTGVDNSPLTEIYRYNAGTGEFEEISRLPDAVYRGAGVWDTKQKAILSIGGSVATGLWHGALHYNPGTGNLTNVPAALHHEISSPCAAFSGAENVIYVFGSVHGLIRFNPDTLRSETIYLSEWPRLTIAPCVHVPQLGRVYIVGGRGSYSDEAEMNRDEILYLELTPLTVPTLVTASTLPTGLANAAAVYDGQDSIYIVGGVDNDHRKSGQVLRYSLEAGTVEVDGKFVLIEDGAVIFHGEEVINFGGMNDSNFRTNEVYSYCTVHGNYSLIGHMPLIPGGHMSVAWDAEGKVAYVFGGSAEGRSTQIVVRYDVMAPDGNMTVVAEIFEPTTNPAAIWDAQQDVAYTFWDRMPIGYEVMQFSPGEGTVSKLEVQFPHGLQFPCAVYADNIDGNAYTFLFGGGDDVGGLIKFDATNLEAKVVPVQGWPLILRFASCAYVPKLGRLYIIGGNRNFTSEASNEISYVQLGEPLNEPPATTTVEETPELSSTGSDTDIPASTSEAEPTTVHTATDEPEDDGSPTLLYTLIAGGVLVTIAIIATVCVCVYKTRGRYKQPNAEILGQGNGNTIQLLTDIEEKEFRYGKPTENQGPKTKGDDDLKEALVIESLAYNPAFEVAKEDLVIDLTRKLGSGHYGVVYKGHVQRQGTDLTPIAVKTVRPNTPIEYFKALMSELKILAHIAHENHENIANLVGAYSGNIKNGELYVGVEFCKMSLLQHLKDQSNGYIELMSSLAQTQSAGDYENPLATDLIRWAGETATGMEFLSQKRIVHGDLAARNVLLSFNRRAKICDFGLARQLVDYTYIKAHPDNLPWKWMAIESLTDMQFSTKSDVWAYGVTLWEIFSLGKPPFPWARWNMDFLKQLLAGHRLPKPDHANEAIYNKMLECWRRKREDRPTFSDLKEFFDGKTVKGGKIDDKLDGTVQNELYRSETMAIGEDYDDAKASG